MNKAGNVLPLILSKWAERRIAKFTSKNQLAGRQDWTAAWISFKAIAEYCAALRTPRKSAAGKRGKEFAYDALIRAMARGAFDVNQRSRVLLLVSHGGKVLSVTSNELLEAREAFDRDTFEAAYLDHCWSRAGLVAAWFRQTAIPAPWGPDARPILHITRKRPLGGIDHDGDVEIIDKAFEKMARQGLSRRTAVKEAITEFNCEVEAAKAAVKDTMPGFSPKVVKKRNRRARTDDTWSETDRLRGKMRQRQKLREVNRTA